MILTFVRGKKSLPVEGLHSYKHFEAPRSSQTPDKVFLFRNLRIALDEERQPHLFRDHPVQQFQSIGIFVEIVGGEHDQTHAGGFRGTQTLHRSLYGLTADLPSGNFDNRAEVAGERAASSGIDTEHGNDVSAQIPPGGRTHNWSIQILSPPLIAPIHRRQLTANRILEDRLPDHLRFGKSEA